MYKTDEKFKLLKRLERNLMLSQGAKRAENSPHESMDEDIQGNKIIFFPNTQFSPIAHS